MIWLATLLMIAFIFIDVYLQEKKMDRQAIWINHYSSGGTAVAVGILINAALDIYLRE